MHKILSDAQALLEYSAQPIDLKNLEITLTIGVHNHVVMLIMSKLFEKLNRIAPKVKIKQSYITDIDLLGEQTLSQYDYIIGAFSAPEKQFVTTHYYDDYYVCFSGNQTLNKRNY